MKGLNFNYIYIYYINEHNNLTSFSLLYFFELILKKSKNEEDFKGKFC